MLDNILTDDVFLKILQDVYKTTEVQFISADLKPISEDVEGFLGEHNNINVTFKLNNVTTTQVFFMKRKPQKNKLQIEMSDEFDVYKKEIFFYDYLLKEYEKYGIDVNFAPKCYYSKPNELLIFENLIDKGFSLSDRHANFTMGQIKCALNSLASFHAAAIIYSNKKTKELKQVDYSLIKEFPDILKETLYIMTDHPDGYAMKFWNGAYKNFGNLIQLLPESEEYKEKFTKMVFDHKYGEVFVKPTKYLKTLGHGDLWSNNMMFKYENGEAVQCKLYDFQMGRYFYPAFDVVLLTYGNTTPSFRKENLHKLYCHYYKSLECALRKHGYSLDELMTFDDFLHTTKLVLRDTMLQVISAIVVVNLPKEHLNSVVQEEDPEKLEKFFFDNTEVCEEAFKKTEKYRNIVIEVFKEYYELLLGYE